MKGNYKYKKVKPKEVVETSRLNEYVRSGELLNSPEI